MIGAVVHLSLVPIIVSQLYYGFMLEDLVNLNEAARFTRYDFRNSFLPLLHDWDLFESSQEQRLEILRASIDHHEPRLARCLDVPKSYLLSRQASLPVVDDWIIYTSIVVAIARQIEANLVPVEARVLFSFRWNEKNPARMFQHPQEAYGNFRKKSLELLETFPYAVETDIAAYFDNIDLNILRRTLLRLGADHNLVTYLISRLLRRWAHTSGRGIPQGPWASSYIGNAQLDSIDKEMLRKGYVYLRYQDDMRVFCPDASTAKRAILEITRLTRELGLTIQAAKTQLFGRDKALTKWRGYPSWLAELEEEELRQQLQEYFASFGPYDDPGDEEPEVMAVEQQALETLFALITEEQADKVDHKGLNFVLKKLGQISSDQAIEYCLFHLADLPHVAPRVSDYFKAFADRADVQEGVSKFICSDACIYDWHSMHLVASFLGAKNLVRSLFDRVSELALDRNLAIGLRTICVDLVCTHGSHEIVREMCRHFENEPYEEVQAAIALGAKRLPAPERDDLLRQWRGISPTIDAAIRLASQA